MPPRPAKLFISLTVNMLLFISPESEVFIFLGSLEEIKRI